MNALHHEWLALQGQHERYEALALAVKLVAVAGTVVVAGNTLALALLGLLWLQEAVLKTFQARLGQRLLVVEAAIKSASDATPMQLHSQWLATRPRGTDMLAQYLKSALRPTVALPYPLLMLLVAVIQS